MRELAAAQEPVTGATVYTPSPDAMTPGEIADLMDSTSRSTDVVAHARLLVKRYRDRKAIDAAGAFAEAVRLGRPVTERQQYLDAMVRLHGTVESGQAEPLPRFDFTAEPEPTDWIIEDWLTPDTLTVLGGYGGCGKSLLMQHMAVEMSRPHGGVFGQPIIGGPCRVLYLDAENPRGVIATRIPALIKAAATDPGSNLYYVKLDGSSLEDPRVQRWSPFFGQLAKVAPTRRG
jgi:hypothetical protein